MKRARPARKRRYCDCGRIARFTLRVLLYRSDLQTEVHAILYLCESCYLLEDEFQRDRGYKQPKATRLG